MTTVYLFKAPRAEAGFFSAPVGYLALQGGQRRQFFLSRPEAVVWREVLEGSAEDGSGPDPVRWSQAVQYLEGYSVEVYEHPGQCFNFKAWETYVALAWEMGDGMPLPPGSQRVGCG